MGLYSRSLNDVISFKVCVEFAHSLCVSVFSLGTPLSYHIPKMFMVNESVCLNYLNLRECKYVCNAPCDGMMFYPWWVLPEDLSCWERLQPLWTGKSGLETYFYWFLLISLKCMHSSLLFQCLILEVFGGSNYNFGKIFVLRNTPKNSTFICTS